MDKYIQNIQLRSGQAVAGATLRVYLTGTSTLATLYEDNETTPKTQPLTTDINGEFSFKAADGDYDIVLDAGSLYEGKTYSKVHLEDYTGTLTGQIKIFFGDATANSFLDHGINIDIGTDVATKYAFAIEASNVNTGQTDLSKTTQFFGIHRRQDAIGGALLRGQSGHVIGIGLEGYAGDNDTTTDDNSTAAIELQAGEQLGTTVGGMLGGIESNVVIIRDYLTPCFIYKKGGHLHARGTGAGFTAEQLTGDDFTFRGRSTGDVATGLTTAAIDPVTTADFLTIGKLAAGRGGVRIQAMTEDSALSDTGFELKSYGGRADTADTTSSKGLINLYATEHDGANALRNAPANANLITVQSQSAGALTTRLLLKADDGELHLGNTTLVALDGEDDVQLVRAMQKESASEGIVLTEADNPFYNYDKLREVGLIGPKDERGQCLFPLQPRLHAHEGAIWQLFLKHQATLKRMQALEARLLLN